MKKALTQYENNCNNLVQIFAEKQGLSFEYWIADIIGEIAVFNDVYFINFTDIYTDLKTEQEKGFIIKWCDEGLENHLKNENNPNKININYSSYIKGMRYGNL